MPRAPLLLLTLVPLLLAGCTQRGGGDADGDGVKDSLERDGWTISVQTLDGPESRDVTSDPGKADTDGDGLTDFDEYARQSDPRDVDTDDDGLLDGEDRRAPDDATASEWRAAGILELDGLFLGELDACPAGGPQLKANEASSDLPIADGLADGEELRGWNATVRGEPRRVTSDPCSPDTDADSLQDHLEKQLGSDPRTADTDGDGVQDGSDADPLWDLGLRIDNLTVDARVGPRVRVTFTVGAASQWLAPPTNASAVVDVPDQSPSRDTLTAAVLVSAETLDGGEPVRLFPDGAGAILTFDLLAGTVEGADADGSRLAFEGEDGSVSFDWSTSRR